MGGGKCLTGLCPLGRGVVDPLKMKRPSLLDSRARFTSLKLNVLGVGWGTKFYEACWMCMDSKIIMDLSQNENLSTLKCHLNPFTTFQLSCRLYSIQ